MPFAIEVTHRQNPGHPATTHVKVGGEVNGETSLKAEKALAPVLAAAVPGRVVIFDLRDVTFVSSAGISVLLHARKTIEGRGGRTLAIGMRPAIRKAFDIVQALPATAVFSTVKELDEYLAEMQRRTDDES